MSGTSMMLQFSREDCARLREMLIDKEQHIEMQQGQIEGATARIHDAEQRVDDLTELIRKVIAGDWCVTDLQEAIGDI